MFQESRIHDATRGHLLQNPLHIIVLWEEKFLL